MPLIGNVRLGHKTNDTHRFLFESFTLLGCLLGDLVVGDFVGGSMLMVLYDIIPL